MRTLLPLLFAGIAPAQTTWIVDDTPGPGVDFTSLPTAVATAASGDTLLVMPGSYQPFQVFGKALTIVGSGSAATSIELPSTYAGPDYVVVSGVPAGTTFRLSGVQIRRDLANGERLYVVSGGVAGVGTTVLTDVVSVPATSGQGLTNGMLVLGAPVHAHRSRFEASWGPFLFIFSYIGGSGVAANAGAVFVADSCMLRGGSPTPASTPNAIQAGDALATDASTCVITRSQLVGGSAMSSTPTAIGGAGLRAAHSAQVSVAGRAPHTIVGGNANSAGTSNGGPGIATSGGATVSVFGPVVVAGGGGNGSSGSATSGSMIALGLPARPALSLLGTETASGALLAGQPVALEIEDGPANQLFVVLFDLSPGFASLAGLSDEPLLLTPAAQIPIFGALDGTGYFSTTFTPATNTPTWVGAPIHWQAFAFDPATAKFLGSNAVVRGFEL